MTHPLELGERIARIQRRELDGDEDAVEDACGRLLRAIRGTDHPNRFHLRIEIPLRIGLRAGAFAGVEGA